MRTTPTPTKTTTRLLSVRVTTNRNIKHTRNELYTLLRIQFLTQKRKPVYTLRVNLTVVNCSVLRLQLYFTV